jgi:hypothetical protein
VNGTANSNELIIQQLTVEVKAIRIGNKQVTQGVFQQLPMRRIIDGATGGASGHTVVLRQLLFREVQQRPLPPCVAVRRQDL